MPRNARRFSFGVNGARQARCRDTTRGEPVVRRGTGKRGDLSARMHRLLTNRDLFAQAKSLESPAAYRTLANTDRRRVPRIRILIYQFHGRASPVRWSSECRSYRADALRETTFRRENAILLARVRGELRNSRKSHRSSREVSSSGGAAATDKSPSKRIARVPPPHPETSCRLRGISHAQLRVKGGIILAGVSPRILDGQTRANRRKKSRISRIRDGVSRWDQNPLAPYRGRLSVADMYTLDACPYDAVRQGSISIPPRN